jgi:hypothetical protein
MAARPLQLIDCPLGAAMVLDIKGKSQWSY